MGAITSRRQPKPRPLPPRSPVHSVYGGAHLFEAGTAPKLGRLALAAIEQYAPNAGALAEALGWVRSDPFGNPVMPPTAQAVFDRLLQKLRAEPVEDFRIDFEDGYGARPDEEEDAHAVRAAEHTAHGLLAGSLPPFFGIRVKPLGAGAAERAVRTLDLYLSTLAREAAGRLPSNFVVTLPKVRAAAEVSALAALLDRFERKLKLDKEALGLELMVELPEAVFGADGRVVLRSLVDAAKGRCSALHFGPYDYLSACGVASRSQTPSHPACELARGLMQAALAGSGLRLSDGPLNILPVPVRKGPALTEEDRRDNQEAVHRGWRLHYDDVRRSLASGFYQGWDLHPAQLVSRYAAVYSFFLEGFEDTRDRLSAFVGRGAQATLKDAVFDDAATGRGLLEHLRRGLACGALTGEEAASCGLTPEELRAGSFGDKRR